MAGNKNVYNSEPLDVVVEALELANGIKLQREYLNVTLNPQAGATQVTLSPKLISGYSPYVDPVTLTISKLNMSAQIPKDMCFSAEWPATFTSFTNFMLASYGVLVKAGQWEIVHEGTVYPVIESLDLSMDVSTDRYITLRPTVSHPVFDTTMAFRLLVTEDTVGMLRLALVGPQDGVIGQDVTVQFQTQGGQAPYSFRAVGATPIPLSPDGTGLSGQLQQTGQFDYVIEVEDASGQVRQAEGSMQVQLADFTIVASAPDGYVHEPYSFQYEFEGGLAPHRLVRVDSIPLGLELDTNGLLTGLPDAGSSQLRAIFVDALGDRFTLIDNITIAGRDGEASRQALKASLVDWLELAGGYNGTYGLQSHPAGTSWSAVDVAHQNVRGAPAAAVKLQRGYFIKTSPQVPLKHIAVAMWLQRGMLSMGGCIFSNVDADSGFEICVSDSLDTRLRVSVMVDGIPYGFETPVGVEVLNDTLALITVQAAEGFLSVHRGTDLIASVRIPKNPSTVTADSPFTVGRRSNYTTGYQWNGVVSRVMVFNQRLWGDQITYLNNDGKGREYREVQGGSEVAYENKLVFIANFPNARLGQTYHQDVRVTGAPLIHQAVPCGGELPPGVTMNLSNPQQWVLDGIPSARGTFTSYWGAQGPQETGGYSITIVVP